MLFPYSPILNREKIRESENSFFEMFPDTSIPAYPIESHRPILGLPPVPHLPQYGQHAEVLWGPLLVWDGNHVPRPVSSRGTGGTRTGGEILILILILVEEGLSLETRSF